MKLRSQLSAFIVFTGCIAATVISLQGAEWGTDFDLDVLNPGSQMTTKPLPCAPNVCIPNTEFTNLPLTSPDIILGFLTSGPLHLQNTLVNDLYCYTYPLTQRSIHTNPSLALLIQDVPACEWSVTVKPFIHWTPRAYVTPKSSSLLTYLSFLTVNDFIKDIDLDEFQNLNIPEVLPLFSPIKIEQRELGGMFALQCHKNSWVWTLTLPLLYLENNYFLTEKQQEAIQNAPLFTGGSTPKPALTPSLDFSTFTEDHLINDKFGIGDLRTELWYNISPHDSCNAFVGGQITFPTAHTLLSGIIGAPDSVFCTRVLPYFDMQTMFNLYADRTNDPNAAVTLATLVANLGVAALDRLSAILLNNPLGTRHASFGPVFRAEGYSQHHNFGIQVTGDVAYHIPQHEVRFFKIVKDPQSFDRDYNDANQAQDNLNFLMQQATDTLYPTATCIKVHPGWTVNLTAAFRMVRSKFTAQLGYNLWAKTQEHFSAVDNSYGLCDPFASLYPEPRYNVQKTVNLATGQSPHALQGKIFGSIVATIASENSYDIRTGIRADATVHTYGLGHDYTVAIDFILDF